ncbi:ATP-binding cassette domain-containing protein [Gayadomonas joobiniege]|uniref:ATP-binding cassette domain-containing protein n=1 Tax=Gayadomonas joobiniege TaxID=1234606 RepID=UPI00037BC8AB|nr:ATP-binding cassette domain-containing protein [Gayadomonas joobiniege]
MISLTHFSLQRGQSFLFEQASAKIQPGQKVGLVGRNGCGKSSLFALLQGHLQVDAGEAQLPQHWVQAHVKQETPALNKSATEYVIDGDQEYRELERAIEQAEQAQQGEKLAELYSKMEQIQGYSIYARAGQLLNGLGFSTEQQSFSVKDFSGGWRMRLNLAQALLCRSDLLLLDEPTNHLDLDAVIWLARFLISYPGTLITISHDRDFLDQVCSHILHIENQKIHSYSGNYSAFEKQRAEKLAQQQAQFERQQREKAHMQAFIDRFKAKASKAKQAQSRVKALARMEEVAPAHSDSQFKFSFRAADKLPNPLLRIEQAQAGYDISSPVLKQINLNLVPGSRIGLLGRNGAGKSTLIKLLAQDLNPLQGEVVASAGLKLGYFAQHQLEQLDENASALLHLQRLSPTESEQKLRDYLGSFAFSGEQADNPVGPFSGGEKARLVLALLVWQKPNLLLLDEPTNHLDLDMRHALSMALQTFDGAMLIVSHDRHILRSTCDEFYLVAEGKVEAFNGDLDDYENWLKEQQKVNPSESENKAVKEHSAQNRKEQKRQQAEQRKKLRPLKQKAEKLMQQLETEQTKMEQIELLLADTNLYTDENKTQLTDLIQQQAGLKNRIETLENDWMEAEEAIQQAETEFDEE